MGAGGEQVFIDIIPRFASGAESAIKDVFNKGINAAFTSRETGLIREVFANGIGTGLAGAIDNPGTRNRLAAVFRSVSGRAGGAASAVGSALASGASTAATAGMALATGGTSLIPDAAMGAIKQAVSFVTDAVEAANPAVMKQFSDALADVTAVLGRALIPVVKMATDVVRLYGDYISSILPDQEVLNDLFDAFRPIMESWRQVLVTLAPMVKNLATDLSVGLTIALEGVAKVVQWLVQTVASLIVKLIDFAKENFFVIQNERAARFEKNIRSLAAGEDVGGFDRSARNAANRGASAVGVLELSRSDQLGAFGGGDPARETSRNTFNTAAAVLELQRLLAALINNWNPRTS